MKRNYYLDQSLMLAIFRNSALKLLVAIGVALPFNHASASEGQTTLSDSFASTSLVVSKARLNQSYALGRKIYELMELGKLPNGRPVPGTYSNEDLKQILAEFDKIQMEFVARVEELLEPDQQAIQQAFVREFNTRFQNEDAANFFQSKNVLNWAKRNSAFLVEALPLSSLVNVFRVLSPEQFKEPTPSDAKELELLSGGMVSVHHLYYISEALNSEPLKSLLPARFDMTKLRSEEERLRIEAKKLFGNTAAIKYQYLIEMSFREGTRTTESRLNQALQQQEANAVGKLQILATRASYAANPYLTTTCTRIKEQLDPNTIGPSNGTWDGVKRVNGTPIFLGSDEMQVLWRAYTSGCYVKKSAAIARTILEQWANAHHDVGKKAAFTHCTLARWHRFGIGGPKDEPTADRWEQRFSAETGGHNCSIYFEKPLIDPTDPWRVF